MEKWQEWKRQLRELTLTLKGLKASWPPWNILLNGFFFPFARFSTGSYTLIVVDKADVFTEQTRCRPSPIPDLKKLVCP